MERGGDITRIGTLLDEEWMTTEPQLHRFQYDNADDGERSGPAADHAARKS